MLSFLNPSRSYDPVRRCVRFAGHDGMFEISFTVDVDALEPVASDAQQGETAYLQAFDKARNKIHEIARKAYANGHRRVYELGRDSFR
ncbi:DUF1488 domain-containing protein [Roseibium litorale]|uniref:DUF1488 domain-containing protein n=1 Tax=Roseibium litorale TaxID=2803841 RepID=A0ABR9CIG3_9HYPH|nr:DUF1488 domain-containing protein [Roseibium litorale]MBD8890615.1 DUF1488 domain-containing protein [Roseibium litorale]